MEPPVPIPNTEVKRPSADDTEGATLCGKYATARRLLTFDFNCFIIDTGAGYELLGNSREKRWLADLRNSQNELAGFSP